ncbi:MAG: tyrosine-type recombinase/integrase [Actinophytocola sp.]|nr:tyrosine-type recombinase/integrase [Actinophytocola sp.]
MPRKKNGDRSREPNGASSIYFSEYDGMWHGRVTVGVKPDGKPDRPHRKSKNKSKVIEAVRKLERARDDGRKIRTGRPWKLEKWLRHWFENIAEPSVKYKTANWYRTAVYQYLIPRLGAHRIDRLEPEHVEDMLADLRAEGCKPSTLRQVHNTLKTSLNVAVKRERLAKNPVTLVKAPPLVEEEIDPFTVEEARRILHAAKDVRHGSRFAIALALGLRQGEALGLKWQDLNEDAGTLAVRRSLQRQSWRHGCDDPTACVKGRHKVKPCPDGCKIHKRKCPPPCSVDCVGHARHCPKRRDGGLVVVETKSRSGRRTINLPEPVLAGLQAHRKRQRAEQMRAGEWWEGEDWLFAQETGKPIDPRRDYDDWQALLKRAGVRPARLHDARHTAATMLLVLGTPTRVVMDVMGWSQASMAKRYQHVPDELRQRIADQMGGLLWSDTDGEGDQATS